MTTEKTIALTRRTLVGKIMSLLLNMLSRLVITFLPRSKSLLISWLQSPSAVILEPKEIKSDTVSTSANETGIRRGTAFKRMMGTSLVVQLLRICLAEQGMWIQSLAWELGFHMKKESEVAQLCPTLWDPMDLGPPGSSIYGIFQARVLEWGAIAFSV